MLPPNPFLLLPKIGEKIAIKHQQCTGNGLRQKTTQYASAVGQRNARRVPTEKVFITRTAYLQPLHTGMRNDRSVGRADAVSLHVRLNEDTTHLIDRRAIAAMKTGAILINTARGPVVAESALIDGLRAGHLRAAYLDVFDTEPLPADSPLGHIENLFITPHMADSVNDWARRFAMFFADNLDRWLADKPLLNVVRG